MLQNSLEGVVDGSILIIGRCRWNMLMRGHSSTRIMFEMFLNAISHAEPVYNGKRFKNVCNACDVTIMMS